MPLPGIGNNARVPDGVYAVIRRADVPLDHPTDDAWMIINEEVVPALTRGAWRGNGLRLGLLRKDQLDAYANAMPQPVGYGETLMNQSPHLVPIIETAQLPGELRFDIDLTRPPMPRHVEKINGGKSSTLRLLARIETGDDGRHTLIITPQHHIPSPYDLIPRDPLEKELDGRVFNELTVRLTLEPNQVAVIGLHWPWPMREVLPSEAEAGERPVRNESSETAVVASRGSTDPAAPPPHIGADDVRPGDNGNPDTSNEPDQSDPVPTVQRVAPALTTHFGSRLLTGMRIRQPVRKVLLISIVPPKPASGAPSP